MVGIPEFILLTALVVLPVGCVVNWCLALTRIRQGQPLLPWSKRDNVPWGLVDLGAIVLLVGLIAGGGVSLSTSAMGVVVPASVDEMDPADQAITFLAFGIATLVSTALSMVWLAIRYGRVDGFGSQWLGYDIQLGLRFFMMLVVPVVGLQVLLTSLVPSRHPLIEMLKESGDSTFLPVAAFAAVFSAPIFEEAFFRLWLQGWLEKMQITIQRVRSGIGTKADSDAVILGGESSSSLEFADGDAWTGRGGVADRPNMPEGVDDARPVLWLPILVTSALFALAHLNHGPDWIPLFFLALGLGYLYQRTGRIQSCVVVHMLVNLLGILQLWAMIRQP